SEWRHIGINGLRHYELLFAILKVGCSIPKLEEFTRYPHQFLLGAVEHLRARGYLYTGQLSNQFLLQQVPGSEDLIERITGQKIIRKESAKMPDEPKEETIKPKRKYKKRESKAPKGDGTLRIKKQATIAPNKIRGSKAKVSFSILYIDNETH